MENRQSGMLKIYAIMSTNISFIERDDYSVSEEETMFPSGSASGSACLTLQNELDNFVENLETYAVTIISSDESVLIVDGTSTVTIIDRSIGLCVFLFFFLRIL